jgi:mannose-6-phosphate isomerase
MVWGGRRLGDILGKQLPTNECYGESWEISDHPLHRSVVTNGSLAGTTLRELMETRREELLGESANYTTFPLLVKYLDCADWLSVQVHPDEEAVKRLWPGEGSKTEAWFVLDAAPGSRIYAGLLPSVGEREMRAALQAGTVAECLHSFEPKPGDCVFLPAGTVHAVGGGVLLAEVQQTSDATFRLFDWNRRDAQGNMRKLHIEEGLASIHWGQGPVNPVHVSEFAFVPEFSELSKLQLRGGRPVGRKGIGLVDCSYFELTFIRHLGGPRLEDIDQGRARIVLILTGSGALTSPQRKEVFAAGQTWLLPASLPNGQLDGNFSALVCTLPSAA